MKNIILIAAPAAGKGSEAANIKNEFNIPHISTGDLLREATLKGDELGIQIKSLIDSGRFVSDEIVLNLLKNRILMNDCENGYILDGFPRNIEQAESYNDILKDIHKEIGVVIVLDIDKEIAKKRIGGRATCPKCNRVYNELNDEMKPKKSGICDDCNVELKKRSDDNPETYDERYETYLNKTKPLIDYYEKFGIVHYVNANKSLEETHNQVLKILENEND